MTKFVIKETLLSSVISKNNYGVIASTKVCGGAHIIKFAYRPPAFSTRGKFLPKNTIFWRSLGAARPYF